MWRALIKLIQSDTRLLSATFWASAEVCALLSRILVSIVFVWVGLENSCVVSAACICVFICCWESCQLRLTGWRGWACKMPGIFSSRGLYVELFSIWYWQVSGWAEASAGKQTGGSSHSLTADPFLFLPCFCLSIFLLSDFAFTLLLLTPPLPLPSYFPPSSAVSFISSWLLCVHSRLLLSAALFIILSFFFICHVAITLSICPVSFSINHFYNLDNDMIQCHWKGFFILPHNTVMYLISCVVSCADFLLIFSLFQILLLFPSLLLSFILIL